MNADHSALHALSLPKVIGVTALFAAIIALL